VRDITEDQDLPGCAAEACRDFQIVQRSPNSTALDNVAAAALFSAPGESLKSSARGGTAHLAFVGLDAQAGRSAATLTLAMRKRLEWPRRWRCGEAAVS